MAKEKTYESDDGEQWEGEREADRFAGSDSLAGKLRKKRQSCSEGEAALGLCTPREGRKDMKPTRQDRQDIYGPNSQDSE